MSDNSASIVSNVWNYAHVLKNAGVGYGDLRRDATNTVCGAAATIRKGDWVGAEAGGSLRTRSVKTGEMDPE